jgi:hypothetical protein
MVILRRFSNMMMPKRTTCPLLTDCAMAGISLIGVGNDTVARCVVEILLSSVTCHFGCIPGSCETEEEYKVSKALLLKYINSSHVVTTIE